MTVSGKAGILPEESIGEQLEFMPLSVRRALDWVGKRVSLKAWRTLPIDLRQALASLGCARTVDSSEVLHALREVTPPPSDIPADKTLSDLPFPERLRKYWPPELASDHWQGLGPVEQFALRHWAKRAREQPIAQLLKRTRLKHQPVSNEFVWPIQTPPPIKS